MADNAKRKPKRVLRVFLCHASGDKPAVRELHQRLCAQGIDAWLDEEKLLPGQDWQLEIPKAVRVSDVVIVCLSKKSINKAGFVQKEIKIALDVADEQPEGAIFLIPARLEECQVPDRLSRWQWVSLFEVKGYDRLMRALQSRADALGISISPVAIRPVSTKPAQRSVTARPVLPSAKLFGGIEFVRVPKGKFIMGSKDDSELARNSEKPQHTVEIPYDYWVARYPVTNDQFAKFVEATRHKHKWVPYWESKLDHPVVNVSWHDAMAYCKWLNETLHGELGDLTLRLLTEAEWEKAARGERGNEWPWGNEFDKTKCNSSEGGKGDTTPVGAYSPQGDSSYGAADMAGNVREWCHSIYKPYPYQPDDGRESESESDSYVVRGGFFVNVARNVRGAYRGGFHLDYWNWYQGFRCVCVSGSSSEF
jgi:formylglycine-generating enzyme required for sulfatase activity